MNRNEIISVLQSLVPLVVSEITKEPPRPAEIEHAVTTSYPKIDKAAPLERPEGYGWKLDTVSCFAALEELPDRVLAVWSRQAPAALPEAYESSEDLPEPEPIAPPNPNGKVEIEPILSETP